VRAVKLKVTKRYIDRYTRKPVEKGKVIEVSESRGKELIGQKVAEPESRKDKVAPVQQEE
jgi:hypothetical protein